MAAKTEPTKQLQQQEARKESIEVRPQRPAKADAAIHAGNLHAVFKRTALTWMMTLDDAACASVEYGNKSSGAPVLTCTGMGSVTAVARLSDVVGWCICRWV